jgi:ATP-dependent Clp protease ATP-binding subunit ClpA
VAQTLRRARLGLANPRRPLASFMFVGPTGVGKTELAKVLAELLFPSGRGAEGENFIRIDMSEFSESFHASKLVGAPAGYVGYKEGNKLADKIKHHPYSVVLFDEIDKAHPDVFNLFLQILDEGHLTDAVGKKINFKNTAIILTTNLGEEFFNKRSLGFGDPPVGGGAPAGQISAETKKSVLGELKNRFRAEFLNRLDSVLVFKPLELADLEKIVEIKISDYNNRLLGKNAELVLDSAASRFLAEEAKKLDQGARAVDKVIRDFIEEPLVKLLLERPVAPGARKIQISATKNKIRFTPTPIS